MPLRARATTPVSLGALLLASSLTLRPRALAALLSCVPVSLLSMLLRVRAATTVDLGHLR
jgi:hypothetical protein